MKKMLLKVLATGVLACTLTFTGALNDTSYAASDLKGGLYFTDVKGNQNEFYDFTAWSNSTAVQQSNMILKYSPLNISVYIDVTKEIAKLSDINTKGSFKDASEKFTEGDISGDFKDVVTGETITGTVNESFEVIGIE